MIPALIILVLLFLNAVFVAAEFAIISTSKATVEQAAGRGERGAAHVLDVLRDPVHRDRYIATAQLGITFASLGLGMYGEHALAEALVAPLERLGVTGSLSVHSVASVLSLGALTYFHIVLGEMIPKTFALQHPAETAMTVNPVIRVLNALLRPVVIALNALGTLTMRLFGIHRALEHKAPTPEHLRYIVEESVAEGQLDASAGEVLAELFDFGELTAAEVMTPRVRVVGIPRGASAESLRALLAAGKRHTRYPVYDGNIDRIVGFVLIRDLLEPLLESRPLSDEIVRKLPFVPETSRLDRVLAVMRREKTQLAVVMDEMGGTAGIVTIEDLFEEVVGEIAEGQAARLPVERFGAHLRAQGFARLDEVGEAVGRPMLEHAEVDTVSGLVLFLLDRPPEPGDRVEWEGLAFTVASVQGHGVKEVDVESLEAPLPGLS